MKKYIKSLLLFFCVLAVTQSPLLANQEHEESASSTVKKFNTGDLIFSHIKDSYEWHIFTIGETHLSIPLPVIIYSETSGFHCFMSGELHHGTHSYQGFKIAQEGKYQRKLVEVMTDGSEVRPWDFSITKNVTSLLVSILIILIVFLSVAKKYSANFARAPKGIQSWIEPIVIFICEDIAIPSIGKEKYKKYVPFLLTIFFFIFVNNVMGLIPIFPGGANVTGDISVTIVLALFTFAITCYSGSRDYWVHLINAPGIPLWLKIPIPLMPIVEIISVFIKPFVLTVRLFANMTAGHIVALGFYSLIFIFAEKSVISGYGISILSITFTVFMGLLELLVAFIQAYVFTLLSALYFGLALEKHPAHE